MPSPDPPLSVQHEVHLLMRGCEHLLSAVSFPSCKPLTNEERGLIEYYGEELIETIFAFVKQ